MGSRLDAEYHAFFHGLRPAVRLSAEPGQAGRIVELYRALGAAVITATGNLANERRVDRPVELIYVARSAAAAEALREAEAPLVHPARVPIEEGLRATRAMGLGLGYPACCVEACCARYERRYAHRHQRSPEHRDGPAQAYLAARDAWVAAPRWQLDDLLFAARISLISFEPCSYACDAATRYADAVLAVLADVDRAACEAMERALRRSVVIDARGGRALVTAGEGVILTAEPLRGEGGRVLGQANEELAPALGGKEVTGEGTIADSGDPPALLVDFAAATPGGG